MTDEQSDTPHTPASAPPTPSRERARRTPTTRSNRARRQAAGWRATTRPAPKALTRGEVTRRIPVGLSTSSVFPLGVEECFRLAHDTGYDGVEVMCSLSRASRDAQRLETLTRVYEQPILSLHAPTLFFLQLTGGLSPDKKLRDTMRLAVDLGVPTVVAHPPFIWQGAYAKGFVSLVAQLEDEFGIELAVENMYPWRLGLREALPYYPDHDPTDEDYRHITIDLSHAATAGDDALAMIDRVGDRLAHLHLTDGSGHTLRDEHVVPGEGHQPVAEILHRLARRCWQGSIVVEISTGTTRSREAKRPAIEKSLAFARRELGHHLV